MFIFLGIIVGTYFCLQFIKTSLFFFVLGVLFTISSIVVLILLYKSFKQGMHKVFFKSLLCFTISFVLVIPISFLSFNKFYNGYEKYDEVILQGRVFSVSEKDSFDYLLLEECKINADGKEKRLGGKVSIILYTGYEDGIFVGDNVLCRAKLKNNELLEDNKFNSYAYKYDIRYSSFVGSEDFVVSRGEKHFDEKCREKVKDILFENLSYDNAGIAYASLFGDKSMLDQKIYESFSVSGTAHLLCVSGLHVGFLVALLLLFLKRLKLKNRSVLIIITTILLLYSYLCGFSPSVVRASIMSIVLSFSNLIGRDYDNLSSLCFAGCLILVINPFYIFDIGFQLSFASCFGIFLLMPIFMKFFEKVKFRNKFSLAFSMTLAVEIATFPIILHNFEKLSFLSLCANIVVIPIFSFLFSLLICFVLINLIFPFGFLFKINELGQNLIVFLTKSFVGIKELTFVTFPSTVFANFMFYSIIFLVSDFVNLSIKPKIIVALGMSIVMLISFVYQFVPKTYFKSTFMNTSVDNVSIVTNSNDEKILIALKPPSLQKIGDLKNDLLSYKINKLNCVLILSYDEQMQESVAYICNKYKVDKLYLQDNVGNKERFNLYQKLKYTQILFTTDEQCYYNNFSFIVYNEISAVKLFMVDNEKLFTLLFIKSVNNKTITFISEKGIVADILYCENFAKRYESLRLKFEHIICRNCDLTREDVVKTGQMGKKFQLKRVTEWNLRI